MKDMNYERIYNCRPNEDELKDRNCIKIRCSFPKTIKKGTYIRSAFPVVSYDAMKEFYILHFILKKPLIVCGTSGHWEGTPFLIYAEDDVVITLEDEKIIQDYKNKVILKKVEKNA